MSAADLPAKRDEFKALSSAFLPTSIVLSAIELGVFTGLAHGASTPAALAERIGAQARPLARLLDALASLGYVEVEGAHYRCSELAATFLVEGAPQYEGDSARMSLWFMKLASGLTDIVRTGRTPESMEEAVSSSPPMGKLIARAMDQIAPDFVDGLVANVDMSGVSSLLDLGGAGGTYAHALVERAPSSSVRATVLELPHVAAEGRRIAAERGWDRVSFRDGDLRGGSELGGPYDVVFASNLFHLLDRDAASALLARAARAVKPGGRLVIKEMIGAPGGALPPGLAAYSILMLLISRGGELHDEHSYAQWCAAAGLSTPRRIDCWKRSSLLIAQRT